MIWGIWLLSIYYLFFTSDSFKITTPVQNENCFNYLYSLKFHLSKLLPTFFSYDECFFACTEVTSSWPNSCHVMEFSEAASQFYFYVRFILFLDVNFFLYQFHCGHDFSCNFFLDLLFPVNLVTSIKSVHVIYDHIFRWSLHST